MVRCDVVMANDVSGPLAFRAMERMGVERVFDSGRVVMVADHFMPAKPLRWSPLEPGDDALARVRAGDGIPEPTKA